MGRIPSCAATWRRRHCWKTCPLWQRPACHCCMCAVVLIPGSPARPGWWRSDTRNSAARSPSSSRKVKGIFPPHRKTRKRWWISSPRERNDPNTTMKIRIRLFTGGTGLRALMRAKLFVLALVTVAVWGGAETMRGAGQYLTVDYPGSAATNELQTAVTYTLWIPPSAAQLRGIIVHQHGAGTTASKEGSTAAYDLHWQALAKKWDCALFSSSYHVLNEKTDLTPGGSEHWFDPRRGSEKTFLKALGEFAAKSGHGELETVPWVLWGHSGGGIWSDVMTTLHPDRVIAVWMLSASALMFLNHPAFA